MLVFMQRNITVCNPYRCNPYGQANMVKGKEIVKIQGSTYNYLLLYTIFVLRYPRNSYVLGFSWTYFIVSNGFFIVSRNLFEYNTDRMYTHIIQQPTISISLPFLIHPLGYWNGV